MLSCPSCGTKNPEGSRFCDHCGNPLGAQASTGEVRKTVTSPQGRVFEARRRVRRVGELIQRTPDVSVDGR